MWAWYLLCLLLSIVSYSAASAAHLTLSTAVRPQETGEYKFSLVPVRPEIECHTVVEIGGHEKIEATTPMWSEFEAQVLLHAGQAVSIKLNCHFATPNETAQADQCPLAVELQWTRPDGVTERVPPAICFLPSGSGTGVSAKLGHWIEGTENNHDTLELPSLRVCYWSNCGDPSCSDQGMAIASKRLFKQIVQQRATTEALNELPYLWPYLSSLDRIEILQRLARSSRLLNRVSKTAACDLYRIARYDSVDQAADVIARWTRQRCRVGLTLTSNSNVTTTRQQFAQLARIMLFDDSWKTIGDHYFVMSDGSCSISAAYILAGCHAGHGTVNELSRQIESSLADSQLDSDAVVSWLIAKAASSEFVSNGKGRTATIQYNPNPEDKALFEAHKTAASDTARMLVARERIARLAAVDRWDAAKGVAINAERTIREGNALTELAQIREELERFEELQAIPANN